VHYEVFSPAVASGVVYVGDADNNVYALDVTTGAKLWNYTTGSSILFASPAIVNGVVYVGSEDWNVYAIGTESVSKQSVLQDFATLRTTINSLPNSAFIPGTKNILLAELNVAELQVVLNRYAPAATTLQKVVLPRMDGCAKTGTPDRDDWVRTCLAQGQLYPQVQNLIQELKVLQGS
jgi:hypothetical protein